MSSIEKPSLFGIENSNRDFTSKDSWGKNQFNSSFPAALSSYMASKEIPLKYITTNDKLEIVHRYLPTNELYGMDYKSKDLFFAFETDYIPYQHLVIGNLPRIDIVTVNEETGTCLRGIEVKLTALPDNSTCELAESRYSSEIVVRPDTIVYMALSLIMTYEDEMELLRSTMSELNKIKDWSEGQNILPHLSNMLDIMDSLLSRNSSKQLPLVMQPIWKTKGKSAILADNSFDVFIWSDFAFTRLFFDVARKELERNRSKISRQVRTVVWLTKMLFDYGKNGIVDHQRIIDELSYNTKNDKAFAVSGRVTLPYLRSEEQKTPRIKKEEISNIILGGGQNLLSPERRLDGIIQNSPELFT